MDRTKNMHWLQAGIAGGRIRRKGWTHSIIYTCLAEVPLDGKPARSRKGWLRLDLDGSQSVYTPSAEDYGASDWEQVPRS
jgi:hypothetical protein